MNKATIKTFTFTSFLIALVAVVLPAAAGAQVVLRNQNVFSKSQVSNIIRNAEKASDKFRTDFRNQMNRNNNLSNSQKDEYNGYVANCEDSLDNLRREFDRSNSWWESRNQVQDVVSSSTQVNTMMNVLPFRRNLESQWNSLRNNINTLADTYDLPGLNGGGWNGGGNGGGWGGGNGGQVSPPNWARGTFYGTAPNGTQITLTISNDGAVSANVGGGMSYGSFTRNNMLNMGDSISRVTQVGNGFSTTRVDNGERIVYTKNGWGNGGGWGGGNGNKVTPPNWAQGTFYGTAPNGARITLNISNNGDVSANIGGGVSYGSYTSGNMINMGDSLSRVSRQGDGFTTTRTDNGERISYSKNGWGNGNGGGWGGGNGNKVTPPNWAQGTFYGTAPNGTQITLTISNNGDVSANIGGGISYGSYTSGNMINMGNSVSRVSRQGNGFTTTRTDNGETIVYRR